MSRTSILVLSIITLVLGLVHMFFSYGFQLEKGFETFAIIKAITIIIIIILWLVIMALVFKDTRAKGYNGVYLLLPFFLGAIGGLVYYGISGSPNIMDKSPQQTKKTESGFNKTEVKIALGVNIFFGIIFGMIALFTIKSRSALPILFGFLATLNILIIIYMSRKLKRLNKQ